MHVYVCVVRACVCGACLCMYVYVCVYVCVVCVCVCVVIEKQDREVWGKVEMSVVYPIPVCNFNLAL